MRMSIMTVFCANPEPDSSLENLVCHLTAIPANRRVGLGQSQGKY